MRSVSLPWEREVANGGSTAQGRLQSSYVASPSMEVLWAVFGRLDIAVEQRWSGVRDGNELDG